MVGSLSSVAQSALWVGIVAVVGRRRADLTVHTVAHQTVFLAF